jgi:hypothetical protein
MAYRALISFAGAVTMAQGEVIDKIDGEIAKDLLRAGYIEEIGGDKPKTEKSSAKSAKTKKGGEA